MTKRRLLRRVGRVGSCCFDAVDAAFLAAAFLVPAAFLVAGFLLAAAAFLLVVSFPAGGTGSGVRFGSRFLRYSASGALAFRGSAAFDARGAFAAFDAWCFAPSVPCVRSAQREHYPIG